MPVVFSGHGSPLLALERNKVTEELGRFGATIIARHGKPKAILAVSAHWYTRGTFVQTKADPRQVYDMYGFPQELYDFRYPVHGDPLLAGRVPALLGDQEEPGDSWGIDRTLSREAMYRIGSLPAPLLLFGSGNVVHNPGKVEWDNPDGSPPCGVRRPHPEHYLPLVYLLGASRGERPLVFNDHCELGSIAMTGYAFGL